MFERAAVKLLVKQIHFFLNLLFSYLLLSLFLIVFRTTHVRSVVKTLPLTCSGIGWVWLCETSETIPDHCLTNMLELIQELYTCNRTYIIYNTYILRIERWVNNHMTL